MGLVSILQELGAVRKLIFQSINHDTHIFLEDSRHEFMLPNLVELFEDIEALLEGVSSIHLPQLYRQVLRFKFVLLLFNVVIPSLEKQSFF